MAKAASKEVTPEEERIEALQTTLSASRLNCFLSCRLRFFFRYVQQIQKPKTPALHLGSAVHSVLKAWNKARWRMQPLSLKQLHDEYAKAWSDSSEGEVHWEPGEEAEDQKTGWRLVETDIRESNIPETLKPDAVEVPVEANLGHHGLPTLIGVLDLVQAGVIIDYKTSGQTPNPEKAAHLYEIQTSGYAVLYREATGKKEQGIEIHTLVKLKTPRLVISRMPPMSDQQQTKLFRIMESYVEGLRRRDWVPSPGMQCSSCEYFDQCRAWEG